MTRWRRGFRSSLVTASLFLLVSAATPADKALNPKLRQAVATKFPGAQIAAWCGGSFLGKPQDAAVALHDATQKQFRVLWIAKSGAIRELQSMPAFGAPAQLELQCLDQEQAKQLKETLQHSEAIHDFLHVPPGRGALCYFVEQTQTKCWSVDDKLRLTEAGGWQT